MAKADNNIARLARLAQEAAWAAQTSLPRNKWQTLAEAAKPKGTLDARRTALLPLTNAEVEKRQHEIHDDLFAGRRWRVRWRDSEGRWQVDGIPPRWWRNYDDINWVWSALIHPDGPLQVQIYDADDDQVVSEPAPPADQPVVVESTVAPDPGDAGLRKSNLSPADLTSFLKTLPKLTPKEDMRTAAGDHFALASKTVTWRLFNTVYGDLPEEFRRKQGERRAKQG